MAKKIGFLVFILFGGFSIQTIVNNVYYQLFSNTFLNIIFYSAISLMIFLLLASINKLRQSSMGYMLIILIPTMLENSYVMKSLSQPKYGLALDLLLYLVTAVVLTAILYFTTDFKAVMSGQKR